MNGWKYVIREQEEEWENLVTLFFERKIYPQDVNCPNCSFRKFHYFIFRFNNSNRGGAWLWCSNCRNYQHFSCVVPSWWENIESVPLNILKDYPEWLDNNLDQWEPILFYNLDLP